MENVEGVREIKFTIDFGASGHRIIYDVDTDHVTALTFDKAMDPQLIAGMIIIAGEILVARGFKISQSLE